MSTRNFTKKVLAEAINKAKIQNEKFDCDAIELFANFHNVNVSDLAIYVKELRREKTIDKDYGKELRCISE